MSGVPGGRKKYENALQEMYYCDQILQCFSRSKVFGHVDQKRLKRLLKSVEIMTVQPGDGYVNVREYMEDVRGTDGANMTEARLLVRIEGELCLLGGECRSYIEGSVLADSFSNINNLRDMILESWSCSCHYPPTKRSLQKSLFGGS